MSHDMRRTAAIGYGRGDLPSYGARDAFSHAQYGGTQPGTTRRPAASTAMASMASPIRASAAAGPADQADADPFAATLERRHQEAFTVGRRDPRASRVFDANPNNARIAPTETGDVFTTRAGAPAPKLHARMRQTGANTVHVRTSELMASASKRLSTRTMQSYNADVSLVRNLPE